MTHRGAKKKYRVWYSVSYSVYLDVDAKNEEEARDIAANEDGGMFNESNKSDAEWNFDEIEELTP
jgi:hypothetical protein